MQYTSGGLPVALPSSRRITKVTPQGGQSRYTPSTNNIIRIGLSPALGFVDTHQSFLSFRILPVNVNFAKECRMDRCSMSWARKLTITAGNGSLLEELDKSHLFNNLMDMTTAPSGYSESTGRALDNSGSKAVRNAKAAHPRGMQYCSGFENSGILNGMMGVLLPMSYVNSEITIEIELAPFNECFVGTPADPNLPMSYEVNDIEYNVHSLTFSEEYNQRFAQQLKDKGIDMAMVTYKCHNSILVADTVDLQISQNAASVRSVYHVLRSKDVVSSAAHDSLSTYKSGNLASIQWSLGGRLTPEAPIRLHNAGVTGLQVQNLQSWNMFRQLSLGSSVSDHNFWSTEAGAQAAGLHPSAFNALPVRRVYGRFVANGKEVYELRQLTIPAAPGASDAAKAAVVAGVRTIDGEFLEQDVANGSKDPAGVITALANRKVKYTHTVNTLHFVPNHARDLSIIDTNMRCKIGSANALLADVGSKDDITTESGVHRSLSTHDLGLDRFYKHAPATGYTDASTGAKKNTNYEEDSANIMYAGGPTQVCWGYGRASELSETYVSGIGVPFVDGLNRPILCKAVGISFEGWVEILPEDSSFYLGCNFQTHQESPNLISGSDLTNATPLLVKLQYETKRNNTENFYAARDPADQLTSFIGVDSILRILPNGDIQSSI